MVLTHALSLCFMKNWDVDFRENIKWLWVLLNISWWNIGAKSGHLKDIDLWCLWLENPNVLLAHSFPQTVGTHYLSEGQPLFFILPLLNLIICIFSHLNFIAFSLLTQSKFLFSRLPMAQYTYYLFAADTSVPIFLRLSLAVQSKGLYYGRHIAVTTLGMGVNSEHQYFKGSFGRYRVWDGGLFSKCQA